MCLSLGASVRRLKPVRWCGWKSHTLIGHERVQDLDGGRRPCDAGHAPAESVSSWGFTIDGGGYGIARVFFVGSRN